MIAGERLYAQLLFQVSNKYASWDPELPIEVGDWGRITSGRTGLAFWRSQGIFIKEGNIYSDGTAKEYDIPDPKEHAADATDGVNWIVSDNATEVELDGSVGGATPIFAQCSIKGSFEFSSGSGALLVMEKDTVTSIDPPGSLRRLLQSPKLKDHVIVSEIHKTSSFARFLSSKSQKSVSIGLSIQPPVANVVEGSVNAKWICSSKTGNFKSKTAKKREFVPLFRLASLKEGPVSVGFRGGMELDEDEDEDQMSLPDAEPPLNWYEEQADEDREEKGLGSRLKFWAK